MLGFFRLLGDRRLPAGRPRSPRATATTGAGRSTAAPPPERIRTVYNGVDPAAFPPAGPEPEVPTLSWAGPRRPDQGPGDPDPRLRAGRGPSCPTRGCASSAARRRQRGLPRTAAQRSPRSWAWPTRVTFEGRVEDIRDAYAAGHVVMLSSISEGFPFTLIEAMSCGRATVSTDVGGVREAVGDTGLVVPPRDPARDGAGGAQAAGRPGAAGRNGGGGPAAGDRAVHPAPDHQRLPRDLPRAGRHVPGHRRSGAWRWSPGVRHERPAAARTARPGSVRTAAAPRGPPAQTAPLGRGRPRGHPRTAAARAGAHRRSRHRVPRARLP